MAGEDRVDLRFLGLRQTEIAAKTLMHRAAIAPRAAARPAAVVVVMREHGALEHDAGRDAGTGDERDAGNEQRHDAGATRPARRDELRPFTRE